MQAEMTNGEIAGVNPDSLSERVFEMHLGAMPILDNRTCLGIKAKDGVVIATDGEVPCFKDIGRLISVRRVQRIVMKLEEEISVSKIMARTAYNIQKSKESWGLPKSFGVSLIYCGYDDDGPQLFELDTKNQMCHSRKATAKGVNASFANAFLQARYMENASVEDATYLAVLTLKKGYGRPISGKLLEVGIIGSDRKFRVLSPTEIDEYIAKVH